MSIMEMEEIKSAIAGVESKVEYNGGGIETLQSDIDIIGDSALVKNGSIIKSNQSGVANIPYSTEHSGDVSFDVNISQINVEKSFLIQSFEGKRTEGGSFARMTINDVELQQNKIVISAHVGDLGSYVLTGKWRVIELY